MHQEKEKLMYLLCGLSEGIWSNQHRPLYNLSDFKDIKDNFLNIITSTDTLIKALLSYNRHIYRT